MGNHLRKIPAKFKLDPIQTVEEGFKKSLHMHANTYAHTQTTQHKFCTRPAGVKANGVPGTPENQAGTPENMPLV